MREPLFGALEPRSNIVRHRLDRVGQHRLQDHPRSREPLVIGSVSETTQVTREDVADAVTELVLEEEFGFFCQVDEIVVRNILNVIRCLRRWPWTFLLNLQYNRLETSVPKKREAHVRKIRGVHRLTQVGQVVQRNAECVSRLRDFSCLIVQESGVKQVASALQRSQRTVTPPVRFRIRIVEVRSICWLARHSRAVEKINKVCIVQALAQTSMEWIASSGPLRNIGLE